MKAQLISFAAGIYEQLGSKALPVVLKSGEGTGTGISGLTSSLVSGLEDIGNNILTAIGQILPTILIVVGGVTVVIFGIKLFKKFAK